MLWRCLLRRGVAEGSPGGGPSVRARGWEAHRVRGPWAPRQTEVAVSGRRGAPGWACGGGSRGRWWASRVSSPLRAAASPGASAVRSLYGRRHLSAKGGAATDSSAALVTRARGYRASPEGLLEATASGRRRVSAAPGRQWPLAAGGVTAGLREPRALQSRLQGPGQPRQGPWQPRQSGIMAGGPHPQQSRAPLTSPDPGHRPGIAQEGAVLPPEPSCAPSGMPGTSLPSVQCPP